VLGEHGTLYLTHVTPRIVIPQGDSRPWGGPAAADVQGRLEAVARRLDAPSDVKVELVPLHGEPADELVAFAEQHRAHEDAMSGTARVATVTAAGLAVAIGAIALGTLAWDRATGRLVARLRERDAAIDRGPATFDASLLETLPPPVARYFAFALSPGQRIIERAHLSFAGTFAAKPNAWARFTAEQDVRTLPPGFVWDARIAMMPLVPVRVRDSYVGGEGAMRAAAGAVVPVVNQHGTPEMAAASLQRFLAEAVWCPTALLPREGLSWSAIDDTSARVTLTDGATTVSLDMTFGPSGEIESTSTMRYRDVKGTPVLTRWVGHHRDYKRMEGMMIPTSGEVAWVLPEGAEPYWRGRLIAANFDWR
jgi:hypothetical protein